MSKPALQKKTLASLAPIALLSAALCAPPPAQAGFNGDTVSLSYSLLAMPGASFSAASATVGAGIEFTGTGTDSFGQIWSFAIDVADSSVNFSWTESTRASEPNGGNIASVPDSWNFNLLFGSTAVPTMALTAFSSSGNYTPGTSSLTHLTYPGPNELHVGFNRLDSTDSYTISAVPEPETWALMLAGLGLLGYRARRKARLTRA